MDFPVLIVNLKSYKEAIGDKALKFCRYASELSTKHSINIKVAVNPVDLVKCSKFKDHILSQHVDVRNYGAYTGHIPLDLLIDLGISGSLLNHSEYKVKHGLIKEIVTYANEKNFDIVVCVDSIDELKSLLNLGVKPAAYAIEPPELIGTGKSVSKYKPDTVIEAVKLGDKYDVDIICGAGVVNDEDVREAIKLGSKGVLVASGIVKAKNPKKIMEEMALAMI